MKLATTTSDYFAYSLSHTDILKHIRKAGFRYADYNFGRDYNQRDGVYSENIELYLYTVANAAEKDGIKLIQAHSPMGKPLQDEDGSFLADTMRCIDACGAWGIKNLVVHSGYVPGLSREETFEHNKSFFCRCLIARKNTR